MWYNNIIYGIHTEDRGHTDSHIKLLLTHTAQRPLYTKTVSPTPQTPLYILCVVSVLSLLLLSKIEAIIRYFYSNKSNTSVRI
jgi:hypothetical protein